MLTPPFLLFTPILDHRSQCHNVSAKPQTPRARSLRCHGSGHRTLTRDLSVKTQRRTVWRMGTWRCCRGSSSRLQPSPRVQRRLGSLDTRAVSMDRSRCRRIHLFDSHPFDATAQISVGVCPSSRRPSESASCRELVLPHELKYPTDL